MKSQSLFYLCSFQWIFDVDRERELCARDPLFRQFVYHQTVADINQVRERERESEREREKERENSIRLRYLARFVLNDNERWTILIEHWPLKLMRILISRVESRPATNSISWRRCSRRTSLSRYAIWSFGGTPLWIYRFESLLFTPFCLSITTRVTGFWFNNKSMFHSVLRYGCQKSFLFKSHQL